MNIPPIINAHPAAMAFKYQTGTLKGTRFSSCKFLFNRNINEKSTINTPARTHKEGNTFTKDWKDFRVVITLSRKMTVLLYLCYASPMCNPINVLNIFVLQRLPTVQFANDLPAHIIITESSLFIV